MIRHFSLQNELGQRWDLDNLTSGFFHEPQGLGYTMEQSYNRVGSNWIRNFIRDTQASVTGTIIFGTEQPYLAFADFNAYVQAAKQLQLVYETDAGEYYKNVDVVKMEKSEINHERHTLDIPVEFLGTGLFYQNYFDRYAIEPVDGEMRYDWRWHPELVPNTHEGAVRFNDYDSRTMQINNNGHVDAAFTCEIHGYAERPLIELKVNNKVIEHVLVPTILEVGDTLYYSSVDGDLYCYVIRANGTQENMVGSLSITNKNFFKIPVGYSTMEFSSDTASTNRVSMTVYKYFRTV